MIVRSSSIFLASLYTNAEVIGLLDGYKKAFLERLEEEKKVARKFIGRANIEFNPKG